jgi:hypothetical protein
MSSLIKIWSCGKEMTLNGRNSRKLSTMSVDGILKIRNREPNRRLKRKT